MVKPMSAIKMQSVIVRPVELHDVCRQQLRKHVLGRFSSGAQLEIMVMAPFIIPEAPKPATARPTINISDEIAAPQRMEPISKIPKKNKKDHCFLPVRDNLSSTSQQDMDIVIRTLELKCV